MRSIGITYRIERMRMFRSLAAGLVATLVGSASLPGQVPLAQTASTDVGAAVAPVAPKDRRVSLTLRGVTPQQAIEEIIRRSGTRVALSSDVLAIVARRDVDVTNVTIREAVEAAIAGTGLQLRETAQGQLFVARVTPVAQAAGTIVGKVVHAQTQQPLSGVNITLDDAKQGIQSSTDGTFRLAATAGEHVVHVRQIGFVRQSRRVTIKENQSLTLEITLEPSTSVLNEVIVTGTVVATERKAIPTPITVITASELEKRNITSIEQLFRGDVPGVIALETGTMRYTEVGGAGSMSSSRVFARGSSSVQGGDNPMKTYVDGVELLDASYLGTIDPRSIERIEIITGPQAATIYGSGAMGGVMQIFTKRGRGARAADVMVNLQYGMLENNFSNGKTPSHNHSIRAAGGSGPEFSYEGTLSYNYTGQWQPALFARTYGGSLGVTHTRGALTGAASVSMTSSANGTIRSAGPSQYCGYGTATTQCFPTLYFKTLAETGDLGVWTPSAEFNSQRISTAQSQTASLNLDYRASSIWQHHVTLGKNQAKYGILPEAPVYSYPWDTLYQVSKSRGDRITAGYNMTLVPRLGPVTSTLTLGINGSSGEQLSVSGCLSSKSATTYGGCSSSITTPVTQSAWGGFGTWQLGFFDRLFLTMGIRGERNPNYGSDHMIDWTPNVGAAYTMEQGDLTVKVLGSYGRATRPPTPGQRMETRTSYPGYDPETFILQFEAQDLRPEYSRGPQAGMELYYGNIASFTINYYKQTITDLIQYIQTDSVFLTYILNGYSYYTGQYQYQNSAKMRQLGWEETASLTLGPVNVKGTYSWTDSRVVSINTNAYTGGITPYSVGESFRYVPTHSGSMVTSYARGGTNLTWAMHYIGTTPQRSCRSPEWLLRSWARNIAETDRVIACPPFRSEPGYVKSDVAFSQRLKPWASFTVNVTNVGNSFTSDVTALFPSLGRRTLLGVTLRLPPGA